MPAITPGQYLAAFFFQTLIFAFFCWSLYKAFLKVRESNRTMPAGLVWLLLIPGFSLFWNFKVVISMASSLHKEFTDRDFEIEKQPGFIYGMIYASLAVLPSILVLISPSLMMLAAGLNVVGLIFFVMYWIKVNWYRKVLENDESDSSDQTSL